MYSHLPLKLVVADSFDIPLSPASYKLATDLIARLDQAYPAFAGVWRVSVNEKGGVIEVTNLALSGKMGFLMHIQNLDPEGRKVVRAGGELLERYRIRRGGLPSAVLDELKSAQRNFKGDLVADCG